MGRRKSLLIGINYTALKQQFHLQGCQDDVRNMTAFLISRGFGTSPGEMVVMTDQRQGPFLPVGRNILAAMDWLVSEPETSCFLHYSGHGGQVAECVFSLERVKCLGLLTVLLSPDGDRASGFDDTIVPLDFQENGQITSDTLHRHLVSKLPSNSSKSSRVWYRLLLIKKLCMSYSMVSIYSGPSSRGISY